MRILLTAVLICLLTLSGCAVGSKDVTKNYGVANVTIGSARQSPSSAEEVVPTADVLTEKLKKAGYTITNEGTIDGITTERMVGKKGQSFIDICYGLTSADTQAAFDFLEKTYSKYYILAINGDYVYCISDKKTFEAAGFKSLANFGTQYIYK